MQPGRQFVKLTSVLAEINYPATPLSYDFNNIGKYVDFFLHITHIVMSLEP